MKGIIGAICGDIIGSSHEFNPIKTKKFKLIDHKSTFTDDSILTLAVAKWLMDDEQRTLSTLTKLVQTFSRNYPGRGYGGRFMNWILSDNPQPYNSYGNGSAMRVSPVSWVANSLDEVEELARKSAIISHDAPEGIIGAQATASAIYLARTGSSKEEIKDYVEKTYDYNLSRKLDVIRPKYRFDETCQKSVPESIICFLESDNYEDTIRNAVSLGGDADTQAAIGGSIASAYYNVPEEIVDMCVSLLDDNLKEILYDFNDFCIE
ncbi:ADP-ribosylglycohydrolase family protein [Methanosphaera sp. WGK6]|uniref:ADP-ribosylglycohydrolase family protein n=1 Tax=Methanosphaera sp. WGK6 TaxID=1561964 RepID=UPI000A59642C|nr:ADP-ribosylglycohydrolase family protein [Methanosphaera sp. WGK6]